MSGSKGDPGLRVFNGTQGLTGNKGDPGRLYCIELIVHVNQSKFTQLI
ncbi:hypothetical protein wTpre_775 [Wolbachia endosymbiont of Trichogramma pretiosum]|nr:hypothetical protein wTpre_775 [Wolbachia endosymbiont of Trichogramma pretiosum]